MPDLDLINEAEQGVRDNRGRFVRGRSGNPAGRPKGCRDHASRAVRALLAGEGEALTRKAIELALAGDPMALRLCLERLIGPCRERAVEFDMPPIGGASDLAAAMAAVATAAAQGSVTPREAMQLGQVVEAYVRAVEATEFERRLKALETADAAMGAVIHNALEAAGVDKAVAIRLSVADEAAAALASIPDTPELRRADDHDETALINPEDRDRAAAFVPKIMAMAKSFADGTPPDFANASFAELLAWSLARYSRNNP